MQTKLYSCHCSMTFSRKDELLRHNYIVHLGDKSRYSRTSKKPKSLLESNESSNKHQCPSCHCSYERSDKLKTHILTVHSTDRPYSCNYCDKTFKEKHKLKLHTSTVHLKRKPFECNYCHQAFGRRDAAKRHEDKWCSVRRNNLSVIVSVSK